MTRNRMLAGAALWVLSVVTVAGLAWFAINSAGRSVSGAPSIQVVVAGADSPVQSVPVATPDSGTEATPRTSIGPAIGPDGSSAPSSAPATTTSSPPRSLPGGQPVSRTFSGAMGRVTVSCTGPVASLLFSSPISGWSMLVDSAGPQEVEVVFGHGSGSSVGVHAVCAAGVPVFTTATGEESGDDGGGSGSNGSGGSGAGSSGSGGDG